jgi:hypothetical protein
METAQRVELLRDRLMGTARGQFVGLKIRKLDNTTRRMSVKFGLTDYGKERVAHMNSLGYMVEFDTAARCSIPGDAEVHGGIRNIHIDRIEEVVIDGMTIVIDGKVV